MKRRQLLAGAALGLPALLLALRSQGCPSPGADALDALRPLLAALPAQAAAVGETLWQDQPWYRDRIAVAQALLEGWPGGDLGPWLVAQIHADYAADRLHRVEGWMLSWTEVRLLLLAARVPGGWSGTAEQRAATE